MWARAMDDVGAGETGHRGSVVDGAARGKLAKPRRGKLAKPRKLCASFTVVGGGLEVLGAGGAVGVLVSIGEATGKVEVGGGHAVLQLLAQLGQLAEAGTGRWA